MGEQKMHRKWTPSNDDDRALVLEHLEKVLTSKHFRKSRRYPALLKRCVQATMEEDVENLRERRLGSDLFERSPDYDTNLDPIVRVTAAEVRKG